VIQHLKMPWYLHLLLNCTVVIPLHSISQLIYLMGMVCVLFEVGIKFLHIIYINVSLLRDNKEICAVHRSFSYVTRFKKAVVG